MQTSGSGHFHTAPALTIRQQFWHAGRCTGESEVRTPPWMARCNLLAPPPVSKQHSKGAAPRALTSVRITERGRIRRNSRAGLAALALTQPSQEREPPGGATGCGTRRAAAREGEPLEPARARSARVGRSHRAGRNGVTVSYSFFPLSSFCSSFKTLPPQIVGS